MTGIERLRIRNYRVLKDIELDGLTPVTVLLGPNGSGKSSLIDAVQILLDASGGGLAAAWARRGGLAEIRSREAEGPVEIELDCRVGEDFFAYRLVLDEEDDAPVVTEEKLFWRGSGQADGVDLLDLRRGTGTARVPGNASGESVRLASPHVLGVDAVGQFANHALTATFLTFVSRFQLSNLDIGKMRLGTRSPRGSVRLDPAGDNLAFRVQYLQEQRPDVWSQIIQSLRRYVPGLDNFVPVRLGDGSQIVLLREKGVEEPILPDNISDGTLKLLGYLVALRDPASVLLLEEPENQVHPGLHFPLAEEIGAYAASGQVIVATHSPRFIDAMRPDEVWMLSRGEDGFAKVDRAADLPRLVEMVESGALLGDLWSEGYFRVGDPLAGQT